jgi:hypothetical protein
MPAGTAIIASMVRTIHALNLGLEESPGMHPNRRHGAAFVKILPRHRRFSEGS